MKGQLKILCGAVALLVAGQVSADVSWTLTGTPTAGVGVSAYANTGGTSTSNNAAAQTIQTATWIPSYGGIANADGCPSGTSCDVGDMAASSNWEHAIDNNQRYDMALLSFASGPVSLKGLTLGNASNDSDVTVMAYTGTGDPTLVGALSKLVGKTYNQLVGLGWAAIGNYYNVFSNPAHSVAINSGLVSSSYWLIGAYNPLAYFAGGTASGIGKDSNYDKIKLASVSGVCVSGSGTTCTSITSVPEPGSLVLFGIAFLGLFGLRRQSKA